MTKQQVSYFWSAGANSSYVNDILREVANDCFSAAPATSNGKLKDKDREEAVDAFGAGFYGDKLD